MTHLAIVKVAPSGRVEKYQEFPTKLDADAHVTRVSGSYPSAYSAPNPGGIYRDWLCDPVAKTVTFSPPPDTTPTPAELAEKQMTDNPAWRGLVKRVATAEGKTPRQVMDEIKAGA